MRFAHETTHVDKIVSETYKDCLVSFDSDGYPTYVSIYCFKTDTDADEFWSSIVSWFPSVKLMNPILVEHDGEKEQTDMLNKKFHEIFDRGLK